LSARATQLQEIQVSRVLAVACALLALGGCGQWQTYKCVRDMVNRSEPYYSQADRDDSEALARQACRKRSATRP
jgi:hypothetical protein